MLETLRQYAGEQLSDSGDEHEIRRRHATYFHDLSLRSEIELRGSGQRETLRRLREEQPNLRAALSWYTGAGEDPDAALDMAGALGLFWHLGRHLEGRDLLEELLFDDRGSAIARARALQAVSIVERPRACLVHPSPRCAETAEESLEIFTELGDRWRAALSKVLLAVEGVTGTEVDRWSAMLDEAESDFALEGDEWGRAVIGFVRMETALKGGRPEEAVRVGHTAADEFRRLDDPWGLSAILYHLGWGLRQFGRYTEAAPVLLEAIAVAQEAGLFNTVQWALADLAVLRTFQGRYDDAAELFARAADASMHVGDGAGEVLATYGNALLAQLSGDWESARSGYVIAIEGFRSLETPVPEGHAHSGLARCYEIAGEDDLAESEFQQTLQLGTVLGEPGLSASALEGLARIARRRGQTARAAARAAQAADIRARFARPAPPHERQDAIAASPTVGRE
jgi:tetratricopeptide (TPR) repeat protein